MSLQMEASLLQYPKFTGSLTAAAAAVPHQIINFFLPLCLKRKQYTFIGSWCAITELGINLSKVYCYAGYWELG